MSRGWSQEEAAARVGVTRNTLGRWELGTAEPYPVHIARLCELYGKSPEGLDLFEQQAATTLMSGDGAEILDQIAVGIEACNTLSDSGGHGEIVAATRIAWTYVPMLHTFLDSSKHRNQAARLLSKVFQHQHGTAYHLGGVQASLGYSEQSLRYARESEDVTETIISLYELASTYEWPLPPLSVHTCRKKGLELLSEAVHLSEKHRDTVPLQVQSWLYTGYAKFLALSAKKQECYTAIGKAQDAYTAISEDLPGLYFNEVNITRQQAIAHSYLSEQGNAMKGFLQLLDVRSAGIASRQSMPDRTKLSIISETVFSSLKLPMPAKDKELTMQLWNVQFDMAIALKSATYIKEAWTTYEIMECVWPDDPGVATLKDALFAVETTNFE